MKSKQNRIHFYMRASQDDRFLTELIQTAIDYIPDAEETVRIGREEYEAGNIKMAQLEDSHWYIRENLERALVELKHKTRILDELMEEDAESDGTKDEIE